MSDTAVMTLTEFLTARLDEDETVAREASPGGWQYNGVDSVSGGMFYDLTRTIGNVFYEQPADHDGSIVRHLLVPEADANGRHIARHDPARVLAEVAAKRRIVDRYWSTKGVVSALAFEYVLRLLASVYASHPDFNSEWL